MNKAFAARIFEDYDPSMFVVRRPRSARAFHPETALHAVADSHVPKFSVAFRYAFAVARKALKKTRNVELMIAAMREALEETLPRMLAKAAADGGRVALDALLRTAGGPGSGNFGHAGRPGQVGGSDVGPGGGITTDADDRTHWERLTRDYQLGSDARVFAWKDYKVAYYKADDEGEPAEFVVQHGKDVVAQLHFQEHSDEEGGLEGVIDVHPDHRRKGIATMLYDKAEEITGQRFRPSRFQTKRAEAFWASRRLRTLAADEFIFGHLSPTVLRWAREHAAELITGISDTTRERVGKAIVDLVSEGDWDATHEKILKAIGDEERADLIARNEPMLAASHGQRLAWDDAVEKGLLTGRERRQWITVGDDKVCAECQSLDGEIATLQGTYPGGYEGPPAHVSCRCTEGLI